MLALQPGRINVCSSQTRPSNNELFLLNGKMEIMTDKIGAKNPTPSLQTTNIETNHLESSSSIKKVNTPREVSNKNRNVDQKAISEFNITTVEHTIPQLQRSWLSKLINRFISWITGKPLTDDRSVSLPQNKRPRGVPISDLADKEYKVVLSNDDVKFKLAKALSRAIEQQKQKGKAVNEDTDKLFSKPFMPKTYPTVTGNGDDDLEDKGYLILTAEQNAQLHYESLDDGNITIAHAQGRQPSMEDAHMVDKIDVMTNGAQEEMQISAVCDGHGGSGWSNYVAVNIGERLKVRLKEFNQNGLTDVGIWNALKIAMVDLDLDLTAQGRPDRIAIEDHPQYESYKKNNMLDEIPEEELYDKSGTTINLAVRINGDLWIANVGDSRAILVNDDGDMLQISEDASMLQISDDASPNDSYYQTPIEARAGKVRGDKVVSPDRSSSIAVARALGDTQFEGAISARPKITKIPQSMLNNATLIQVCDGVPEVSSSVDIAQKVHNWLGKEDATKNAALDLIASAYQAGSSDNLSAIVTKF